MFYHCVLCDYDFEGTELSVQCPDCGSSNVRPATSDEWEEHLRMKQLVTQDNWDDATERH